MRGEVKEVWNFSITTLTRNRMMKIIKYDVQERIFN